MLRIGLTGGIACGKSFIGRILESYNVKIIDSDLVSREIVLPGQPALLKIREIFGEEILLADGSLNRKALREKVFADKEALSKLNAVTHPAIRERTNELAELISQNKNFPDSYLSLKETALSKYQSLPEEVQRAFKEPLDSSYVLDSKEPPPYIIIDIPLLFENKLTDFVDFTVVVDVPEELQLRRMINRDHCSKEEALRIISCQVSRSFRLEHADFVISAAGDDTEEKRRNVLNLHRKLVSLRQQKITDRM